MMAGTKIGLRNVHSGAAATYFIQDELGLFADIGLFSELWKTRLRYRILLDRGTWRNTVVSRLSCRCRTLSRQVMRIWSGTLRTEINRHYCAQIQTWSGCVELCYRKLIIQRFRIPCVVGSVLVKFIHDETGDNKKKSMLVCATTGRRCFPLSALQYT